MFAVYGVARLQFSGTFTLFTKRYLEVLHLIIVLGAMMASFFLIPFRGAKIIQSELLKEAIGRIEIEYEL